MKTQLCVAIKSRIFEYAAALSFVLAVFAVRVPHRMAEGYLWAEDLTVFLRGAYEDGAASLFSPYAGYLHMLPRLLAYALARCLPAPSAPYAWPAACLLVYVACAVYWFRAALRQSGSRRFAAAFAALPFLCAHSGELFLTLTNLQWITAPVMLVLFWETFATDAVDHGWKRRAAALAVLILTGPFALLFAPAFALILWSQRRTLRGPKLRVLAVCGLAGAAQLAVMQGAPLAATPGAGWSDFDWIGQFGHNFVAEIFLPRPLAGAGWPASAALLLALLIGVALRARQRRICLSLIGLGVLLWAVGVYRTGTPALAVHWYGYGGRYLYIPFVFCGWALLVAARDWPSRARWLPLVLLGGMLCSSLHDFRGTRYPTWRLAPSGDHGYRFQVPPGLEADVHDRLRAAPGD